MFTAVLCLLAALAPAPGDDSVAVGLPPGVRVIWDLDHAAREATPTRERVCLNGLWRWQPAGAQTAPPPENRWGYFKVPGCWPGITDYMQKDCQIVHAHPDWQDTPWGRLTAAWYKREVSVPNTWTGRRIRLSAEYLNSFATVFVDGHAAGELRFPAGELDLTSVLRPGGRHVLSLLVVALPLKGVMRSYTDTAAAREVKGSVARRGLCGDVYLASTPAGPHLADVKIETSVRQGQISFGAGLRDLAADTAYTLRARVTEEGRTAGEYASPPFTGRELQDGRITFRQPWKPGKLWDIHTPTNMAHVQLALHDRQGRPLDIGWPERCGFREFWIDGRDFFLNGSRIFLSSVPLDNAQVGAAWASYAGARESLERLKRIGINFVYTHHYDCEPGSHLSVAEILRAADDVGMLVALSQPHFSHYDWEAADADAANGYARHAEFYAHAAQNHPSVVFYAMSHNATGYSEDMNPDLIDGTQEPRDQWALRNSRMALRAEAIVRRLDPGRIVYHHASGNLGTMHTVNYYANFAPIQEQSDWFEHWATQGVKPLFTCEYSVPFTWDWTMYRGWYKGQREFGSAKVPWEFCLAEWNAQFLGDRAYQVSEMEKANLRWEARQFHAGNLWHRWDYPYDVGSRVFEARYEVLAQYLADNWRAFRTWGVSATSPWEYGHYWRLRDGVDRTRRPLPVDWEHLQQPGFSPDYLEQRYDLMDQSFEPSDWIATAAADAILRNNRPVLAYLAGKPAAFTSKDHNFHAGETVEKQLILINNSRETVTGRCQWSLGLPRPATGAREITVPTGDQARVALRFKLPAHLAAGRYELGASVRLRSGEIQSDSFFIDVVPRPPAVGGTGRIALFDPQGKTARWLEGLGVRHQKVDALADLAAYDTLIVGQSALTPAGPAPDITRVREGLKVVIFEQTSETLEQRFGFRVAEQGLRRVFPRMAGHPALSGIRAEHLADWRGAATILPPRLKYEMRPRYGPTVEWCGLPVTRLWRCGNRGSVASVLIEKPARGDFRPILDGGYSLQYSPLLEYREGQGLVLFCQMDVTGRTESDPVAETLAGNLLRYLADWKPAPERQAVYAGEPAGKTHLVASGVRVRDYEGGTPSTAEVLVVGPAGGQKLARNAKEIADWLRAGGNLVAIGLNEQDANAFLPFKVGMKNAEHIAAWFEPFEPGSFLAGIGPADVHNRDPRELPLVSTGALITANGVLARAEGAQVVFCQLVPWSFGDRPQPNLRRTYRRASFLVSRLLANAGVAGSTPVLARFHTPSPAGSPEKRWLDGLYLDQPEEWDDPYRFFRW